MERRGLVVNDTGMPKASHMRVESARRSLRRRPPAARRHAASSDGNSTATRPLRRRCQVQVSAGSLPATKNSDLLAQCGPGRMPDSRHTSRVTMPSGRDGRVNGRRLAMASRPARTRGAALHMASEPRVPLPSKLPAQAVAIEKFKRSCVLRCQPTHWIVNPIHRRQEREAGGCRNAADSKHKPRPSEPPEACHRRCGHSLSACTSSRPACRAR